MTRYTVQYMEKLKRFLNTGYTRIELSIYGSTLFSPTSYERAMDDLLDKLAGCPTFNVPLWEQWHMIVDKLTQVAAVYVCLLQLSTTQCLQHLEVSPLRSTTAVVAGALAGLDVNSWPDMQVHQLTINSYKDPRNRKVQNPNKPLACLLW